MDLCCKGKHDGVLTHLNQQFRDHSSVMIWNEIYYNINNAHNQLLNNNIFQLWSENWHFPLIFSGRCSRVILTCQVPYLMWRRVLGSFFTVSLWGGLVLVFSAYSYKATFSSDCCSTWQIHNEINKNDWFLDPWQDWLQAYKWSWRTKSPECSYRGKTQTHKAQKWPPCLLCSFCVAPRRKDEKHLGDRQYLQLGARPRFCSPGCQHWTKAFQRNPLSLLGKEEPLY